MAIETISTSNNHDTPKHVGQQAYTHLQWQLVILGFFRFSEALAWTTIFPYIFFMMQSFLPDNSKRDANAAVYASLTVALFTFGEFLTSIIWTKVSDRLGRKPTLIIGAVGGSVSALAFGCSTNLWMALGVRVFGGLINPNVGVISACVGELVKKKEHQGRAFSVVPFLRGLGSLVGPVIGGYLADPVKNFPSKFHRESIWEAFPYLLPNLVVVLFIMASGLSGFFFLEESHPEFRNHPDLGRNLLQWVIYNIGRLFAHGNHPGYTILPVEGHGIPLTNHESKGTTQPEENLDQVEDSLSEQAPPIPSQAEASSAYTFQVILHILSISLLAFHKVSSDVILPIFLATPANMTNNFPKQKPNGVLEFKAGFGMTSPSISNILLTQAITSIVSHILIVPMVIKYYGPLQTFRWTTFVFPWLYCLTPFTARLIPPFSIIVILLDIWIKGILVSLGYVSSAILLTNATPLPKHLATVNGIAASVGCLARSIGAAISGSMFHVGITSGYIGIPFWTLGAISAAGACLSWALRDEL